MLQIKLHKEIEYKKEKNSFFSRTHFDMSVMNGKFKEVI